MILRIVAVICAAVMLYACGSSAQSLIVGNWEADAAIKMSAEFRGDGTARLNMLGHTMQGTYKVSPESELEWTMNGITTKGKVHVTATELEVTDGENRTIKYKRR
jgi:hypothetical protein